MSSQSFGDFQHQFYDWLCLDHPYKNLREQTNLTRPELAGLLKISSHSIRRYETENKAPHWYFLLLRLIAGDLSFYGAQWHNVTIQPHDRRLKAPELSNPLYPLEFNAMYNRPAHSLRVELERSEMANKALEMKLQATERMASDLKARIDLLENENARLKSQKSGIKKGTVVPLFGHK